MGEYDDDLALFGQYVQEAEGVPYHSKWLAANKNGDAPKWAAFRNALLAGESPTPPTMSTRYGRALVLAGKQHMSISHFVGVVVPGIPPPPQPPQQPPPPPPSGVETSLVQMTAYSGVHNKSFPADPGWDPTTGPTTPFPDGGGVYQLGNGIRHVCTTETWANSFANSNAKLAQCVLSLDSNPFVWMDKHMLFEWDIVLPSATNAQGWPIGWGAFGVPGNHSVLVQWIIPGTVGHEMTIFDDGRMAFEVLSPTDSQFPSIIAKTTNPVPLDTSFPVSFEVLWSTSSAGFINASINNETLITYSGVTARSAGAVRSFGVGWYSPRDKYNEIQYLNGKFTTFN